MSKFNQGDICKVLWGHRSWYRNEEGVVMAHDARPEWVGQKVYINYSYADMYGGDSSDSYAVTFFTGDMTGQRISWFKDKDLEFIEHAKGRFYND